MGICALCTATDKGAKENNTLYAKSFKAKFSNKIFWSNASANSSG